MKKAVNIKQGGVPARVVDNIKGWSKLWKD